MSPAAGLLGALVVTAAASWPPEPGSSGSETAPPAAFANTLDGFVAAVNDAATECCVGAPEVVLSADPDAEQFWSTSENWPGEPGWFVNLGEPVGAVIGGATDADGRVTSVVVGVDAEAGHAGVWAAAVVDAVAEPSVADEVMSRFGEVRNADPGGSAFVVDDGVPGRGYVLLSTPGLVPGDPLTFVVAVPAPEQDRAVADANELVVEVLSVRLAFDLRSDYLSR